MVKTTVTLSLDYEVFLEAKARHENLSGHINDLLTAEQTLATDEELDPKVLKKMLESKDKLIEVLKAQEEARKEKEEKEAQVVKEWSGGPFD